MAEMAKLFLDVEVYSVPGNHSRVFPNKEDNQHGEYLDRLVSYYVQAKCAQINNVHVCDVDYDGSMVRFAVRTLDVFAVHGDKDTPTGVVNSYHDDWHEARHCFDGTPSHERAYHRV